MTPPQPHSWNVTPAQARQIQEDLRNEIIVTAMKDKIEFVAGADVSFDKGSDIVYAAIVVMRFPSLDIVEIKGTSEKVDFPYIPGLLAFREGPSVLSTWDKLHTKPDIIIFDAQGLAHPRRFGLASHLGVILDIPSIGCAKSILVGHYEEPEMKAGSFSLLKDNYEVVGAALRTKDGVSPIYISIGHRVDLPSAISLVLQCTKGYRVPEPTRQAHLSVNELRKGINIDMMKSSIQESLF